MPRSLCERDRYRLYEHLRQVLDDQDANTLMAHLPPGGWAETATTSDLSTFQSLTTAEIDTVRLEMGAMIANLRTELGSEITTVRTEAAATAVDLSNQINDLRSELYRSMTTQTRTMVVASVASNATVLTLALGVARLA